MKKSMPILSKVMVIGDEKQHLIMFVTLKCQVWQLIGTLYTVHTHSEEKATYGC